MSRRERILAIIIGALVLLFAADRVVVSPLMAYYDDRAGKISRLEQQVAGATVLIENRTTIESRWKAYSDAGLAMDESALRLTVQREMTAWSRDSQLNLTALVSGRTVEGEPFNEVQFIVTGTGSMRAVSGFLDRLHSSPYPLRVTDMDLSSRGESGNDLNIRLTVSTIFKSRGATEGGTR